MSESPVQPEKCALSARQVRVKRLIYRSSYTGMKETDLLLGQFAARHLSELSDDDLDMFEALLDAGDPRILAWVQGDEQVPEAFQGTVIDLLKNFKV